MGWPLVRHVPHRQSPEMVTWRKSELAWEAETQCWHFNRKLTNPVHDGAHFIFRGWRSTVQQRVLSTTYRRITKFAIWGRIPLEQALCMFHIPSSVVGIVTQLWTGRPTNHLSILGRVQKFFSPDSPQQSWIPLSLLVSGYRGAEGARRRSPGVGVAGA